MNTILISGANRGIGLEFVKQLSEKNIIIATCRDPSTATDLQTLVKNQENILIRKLDVTNDGDISSLAHEFAETPLDWIINNAGVSGTSGVTVGNIERDNFLNLINVNCLSPLKLSEALLPQLRKGEGKLVICISSSMGSISENNEGRSYAYRASKAALNCVMRSFAVDVRKDGINVLLLNPGWVKTRLGGAKALMDVQTSVSAMLQQIALHKHDSHPRGLLNYDGRLIDW